MTVFPALSFAIARSASLSSSLCTVCEVITHTIVVAVNKISPLPVVACGGEIVANSIIVAVNKISVPTVSAGTVVANTITVLINEIGTCLSYGGLLYILCCFADISSFFGGGLGSQTSRD